VNRFARMRLLVLLLGALWPFECAPGQTPGGSSPTTEAMISAATSNTIVSSAPVTHAPVLLTGRVLLENGSPPPHPAKIERVCNSVSHSEGFTDTQGNFGVHLGSTAAVTQDADEQDRLAPSAAAPVQILPSLGSDEAGASLTSDKRLLDCEIRAVLAGYHARAYPLQNLRLMENLDIGVILLKPNVAGSDGSVVTAHSLAVPKAARKLFERAQADAAAGRADQARQRLEKLVALYPQYADAWCALGKLQVASGGLDAARASFEHALHADPNSVDPYLQLATVALWDRKWQELADLTAKGIGLDPISYPQLFLYAAVANYNLRRSDLAQQNIERAQALDARHAFPEIERMAGVIMASRKDYVAAVEHLRAYLQLMPDAGDAADTRSRLAEAEKMTAQAPAK